MIRPENVPVAVDIIIELPDGNGNYKIVLIERRNPPHGWALPGGFVECGESVADAARREAKEETGLDVTLAYQLGVYSRPGRDPRGPVVSICFVGWAEGTPKAADDAKNLRLVDIQKENYPDIARTLAFDHGEVLWDYLNYRGGGPRPPLDR